MKKTTYEQETEQSLLVAAYTYHLFLKNEEPSLCTVEAHFVPCVWCCSLEVTLPLRFRLDLCLGRNVPSQPGMTTAWDRPAPSLELHREAACWLSYDETKETNIFPFIIHISGFGRKRVPETDRVRVRPGFEMLILFGTIQVNLVGCTAVKEALLHKHCGLLYYTTLYYILYFSVNILH